MFIWTRNICEERSRWQHIICVPICWWFTIHRQQPYHVWSLQEKHGTGVWDDRHWSDGTLSWLRSGAERRRDFCIPISQRYSWKVQDGRLQSGINSSWEWTGIEEEQSWKCWSNLLQKLSRKLKVLDMYQTGYTLWSWSYQQIHGDTRPVSLKCSQENSSLHQRNNQWRYVLYLKYKLQSCWLLG